MTISSTTTKNQYAANGSTTVFAYAFKIFADADIKVIVTTAAGVESVKSLSSDYTVSGAGSSSGGNVTFGTAPANGETVTLLRNVAITQSVDYVANDAFPAEAHEGALDRLTAIAQQQDSIIDRSIRVPQSDGSATLVLPNKATRAGGFLSFDSTGNVAINSVANLNFLNLESLTIDNLKLDANTFSSLSGNITVDSAGDISLDNAANSSVNFLNAGTAFAEIIGTASTSELRLYGDAIGTLITLTAEHVTNSSTIARLKTDNAPLFLDTDVSGTIYLQTTISSSNDLIKLDTSTSDTLKISTSTSSGAAGDDVFILSNTGLVIDGSVTATAFSGPITGDVTGNAATASQVAVAESGNTNTDYEIVFVTGPGGGNESLFVDNATLEYNPSTETLKVPRIYVASVSSGGAGSISFEGATNDAHETTLIVTDPTADRTITLPDSSGTLAFNTAATTSVPGLMSSSDKSKLDAIEASADVTDATNVASAGALMTSGGTLTGDLSGTNVTLTGYLRGPSSFTIDPATHGDNTGTVVIAGNLQIDGTTTTINSTTLDVDDLNITVAKGAANAAAANGAGLTIDGANITFSYDSTADRMELNKDLFVYGNSVNGEDAFVHISMGSIGGDDIHLQGVNPNLSHRDTDIQSSGVPAYIGGTNYIGRTSNSAYHTFANIRPYVIEGLDSDSTGRKGALHFGVSDRTLAAATNIILKVEPTGVDVTGNIVVSGTVDGVDIATRDGVLTSTTTTANAALPTSGGTITGDVKFNDNKGILLGTDSDAEFVHTGIATFLYHHSGANGDLNIKNEKADSDTTLWADGGSGSTSPRVRLRGGTGVVEINHYSDTKISTSATGVNITGNASFDDNGKAIFGSELEIYSDGTSGFIKDVGSGDIKILSDDFYVQNAAGTSTLISVLDDGKVGLGFAGGEKLATTSGGIIVTGTAEADAMKIDNGSNHPLLTFEQSAAANQAASKLVIGTADASVNPLTRATDTAYIVADEGRLEIDAPGDITVDAGGGDIILKDDGIAFGRFSKVSDNFIIESQVQDGDMEFRGNDGGIPVVALSFNMGNSGAATFNAGATFGGNVGITTTNPGFPLSVEVDNNTWVSRIYNTGSDADASGLLVRTDATSTHDALAFGVYADSSYKMVVRSTGNVGIGATSPDAMLHVKTPSTGTTLVKTEVGGNSTVGFEIKKTGSTTSNWRIVDGQTVNGTLEIHDVTDNRSVMMFDGSGNVGIGHAPSGNLTAGYVLRLDGGSQTFMAFNNDTHTTQVTGGFVIGSDSSAARITQRENQPLHFDTNDEIRMTIDGNGNVGIGASSPQGVLDLGAASTGRALTFAKYNNIFGEFSEGGLHLASNYYGSTSANSYITSSTATFGAAGINISGVGGSSNSGVIEFFTDAAASKTAGAAFVPTERMRLTSAGDLLVGKTSASSGTVGAELRSTGSVLATADGGFAAVFNRETSDGEIIRIKKDDATVGTISVTSSATAYNTSSDYRLKENVVYDWDATTRLKQLKPSRFNFIVDPDNTFDGFLAHEVSSIVPEAITGTKDEVDDDGNAVMQGIDQSKLVPLLVKTIQELEARITALENA
tara:strand:+ start:2779 stop:7521 length:4743 start_codon:yes stop_codon:yes gene_type:complete